MAPRASSSPGKRRTVRLKQSQGVEASRQRAALHEAGHVVVAYICSDRLVREVGVTARGRGRVIFEPLLTRSGPIQRGWDRPRREMDVMCALGGLAAERVFTGKLTKALMRDGHAADDLRRAFETLETLIEKPHTPDDELWTREQSAYFELLWVRTVRWLSEPAWWKCVVALRDALLLKGQLTGQETREIIEQVSAQPRKRRKIA